MIFRLGNITIEPKTIIIGYLNFFLIIDILNGALLHYVPITSVFSLGDIVRLTVFIALTIELILIRSNRLTTLLSILLIFISGLLCFYFLLNEGSIKVLIYEFSYLLKILIFLFIIIFLSVAELGREGMSRIFNYNFFVFSLAILLSHFTGLGFNSYSEGYYESTKGFFHGNNPTAIVSLTFGYYFLFIEKSKLKYLLSILVTFFTGSKVFLIVGLFYVWVFVSDFKNSLFRLRASLLLYITAILIVFASLNYLYQKIWEERYYQRAKTVLINSERSGLLSTDNVLGLYAFISFDRAYNATYALKYLDSNPSRYIMGVGAYKTHNDIFGHKEFLENDFFNLLTMYGVIGLVIYMSCQLYFIWNLQYRSGLLVVLLILYAFTAGHFIFPPMSNTLLAVVVGFGLNASREDEK